MICNVKYANTKLQRLDQHSFAVGYVAQSLCKHFYGDNTDFGAIIKAVYIAGVYHDLGKLDTSFCSWVTSKKSKSFIPTDGYHVDTGKFSFDKHPTHNEISVLIYYLIDDRSLKAINPALKQAIKHVIYWHHSKPLRNTDNEFRKYGDIYRKTEDIHGLVSNAIHLIHDIIGLEVQYRGEPSQLINTFLEEIDHSDFEFELDGVDLPAYKSYRIDATKLDEYKRSAEVNATHDIIRSCVITADRWVSSLSAKQLAAHISEKTLDNFFQDKICEVGGGSEDLSEDIAECLNGFPNSDRSKKQSKISKELAQDEKYLKVLAGAAGCGKTKIALEWAQRTNAKKIIWVCPRVQICQGIFAELRESSDDAYLPTTNVELLTGEYKYLNSYENVTPEHATFSGDIVITTIDQILGAIVSHNGANRLFDYLSAHVIFDEYHEYIQIPAFNLLLAELACCKRRLDSGPKTLFVTATPHYSYLENILNIESRDVVEMPSFNRSKYQVEFQTYTDDVQDESNPLYKAHYSSTFIISNTAKTAQSAFLRNYAEENVVLFHSKLKKTDKADLFHQVFDCFKSEGSKKYDVLRSGPIVQASLNITCDHMVSELTNSENTLQRIGRLDRFGMNADKINRFILAVPADVEAGKSGPSARFLASMNTLESTKAWYRFFQAALDDGNKVFTLPDLYRIYRNFYKDPFVVTKIESDLIAAMQKSAKTIAGKLSEPKYQPVPRGGSETAMRLSRSSLRDDSRFVQMALCEIKRSSQTHFLEQYAYVYDVESEVNGGVDSLTEACERILGFGDSARNLLSYMQRKHHSIFGGKKAYKDFVLLDKARFPQFPIYLSYIPSDLKKIGGEKARHEQAYYYVICEKQAVGVMSSNVITSTGD